MTKAKSAEMREYILTLKGGNIRKIQIPGDWTFTYGSLVPPIKGNPHSDGRFQPALRLYGPGGKTDLRAVMTDVAAIRDCSIRIMERQTNIQRKAQVKQTGQGAKEVMVEARVTEWVDPDGDEATSSPNEFLPQIESKEPF